jgi:hypothetical protein
MPTSFFLRSPGLQVRKTMADKRQQNIYYPINATIRWWPLSLYGPYRVLLVYPLFAMPHKNRRRKGSPASRYNVKAFFVADRNWLTSVNLPPTNNLGSSCFSVSLVQSECLARCENQKNSCWLHPSELQAQFACLSLTGVELPTQRTASYSMRPAEINDDRRIAFET